jgi:cell division protein FtsB
VFLAVAGVFVFIIAVLANYGPLQAYSDAKNRLDRATTAVAELKAQKADLQAELGKLSEADYLESLARQDLSYTRPGEELYIVSGGDETEASDSTSARGAKAGGGPGLLERVLDPVLNGR